MAKVSATKPVSDKVILLVSTDDTNEEFDNCTASIDDDDAQTLIIYKGEAVVAEFKQWNYWRFE